MFVEFRHKGPFFLFWFVLVSSWAIGSNLHAEQRELHEFNILASDGQQYQVPSNGHTVVCFMGIGCPLSKLYSPRLNDLAKEFQDANFRFIAINSNHQDSADQWHDFANEQFKFSNYKDTNNLLADQFQIKRNPEVVVFDETGAIRYRGRIDDQFSPGVKKPKAGREDLRIALQQLRDGVDVDVEQTTPQGCLVGRIRKQQQKITYSYASDVAKILQRHCIECHRDGAIGPFALADYDQVVGWGEMMVETIDSGRMPPWHAAQAHDDDFVNSRRLTEREKQIIRTWVAQGTPLGDPQQLPKPREFVSSWQLPQQPDLVIPMSTKPFTVPADGVVDYQYFVVDPGFEKDQWVGAAEVVPGNAAVVHHSLVFIRPPDGVAPTGASLIGGYVPGQVPIQFDPKRGQRIPAGSKLIFQQHYTPNGSVEKDITKIGLVFMDEADVQQELFTIALINQDFEIQPHQKDAVVKKTLTEIPDGASLISISPHMHYRGKSFKAMLKRKSGETNTLLSVPKYDFNWQHIYEFRNPLPLSKTDEIEMEVHFDNSKDNPFNPNPDEYVVWGDQTWEEMAVGFLNVSRPVNRSEFDRQSKQPDAKTVEPIAQKPQISDRSKQLGRRFAESLIAKNDANGDGVLKREEMPRLNRFLFFRYDTDGNGKATRQEIEAAAALAYERLE